MSIQDTFVLKRSIGIAILVALASSLLVVLLHQSPNQPPFHHSARPSVTSLSPTPMHFARPSSRSEFIVQLGRFSHAQRAHAFVLALRHQSLEAHLEALPNHKPPYWRVYLGPEASRADALRIVKHLKQRYHMQAILHERMKKL